METQVYNQKGESIGKISLPESIFGLGWNGDLVHQVVTSMTSSARSGTAHTKNRGDVRGGGKKPWRQKGTGRARHGSTRSPIWVGGGVTHGPRSEKNYFRKVNKKMKIKALFTALSQKMRDKEIAFIDDVDLKEAKTKNAIAIISDLKKISSLTTALGKKSNAALLAFSELNPSVKRSFSNIGHIEVEEVRNLNPLHLMKYKTIIFFHPEESLRILQSKNKSNSKNEVVISEVESEKKVKPRAKKALAKPKKS